MSHIQVLTTGGTIDKVYGVNGELEVGKPAFEALIAPVLSDLTYDLEEVLAIDSLEMTDADRAKICAAVEATPADRVLITHGTDTMVQTAAYLRDHLSESASDKVIVLTGAMQPASMRSTDAAYNLGAATAAVQLLPPGVHIAMSGRIFPADRVVKDVSRGVFVERDKA
ncbi:MAG: asparaginase domain-containing protein [Marmoricola sp.]